MCRIAPDGKDNSNGLRPRVDGTKVWTLRLNWRSSYLLGTTKLQSVLLLVGQEIVEDICVKRDDTLGINIGRVCKVLPTTKMVPCRHLRSLETVSTIRAEARISRVCVHAPGLLITECQMIA